MIYYIDKHFWTSLTIRTWRSISYVKEFALTMFYISKSHLCEVSMHFILILNTNMCGNRIYNMYGRWRLIKNMPISFTVTSWRRKVLISGWRQKGWYLLLYSIALRILSPLSVDSLRGYDINTGWCTVLFFIHIYGNNRLYIRID